MNLTKNSRRAAYIAVPALLLGLAACGSDAKDKNGSASSDTGTGAVAKVAGDFGKLPTVTAAKKGKPGSKMVVQTISEGKGKTVAKGDTVRVDALVRPYAKDQKLVNTYVAAKGSQKQQFVTEIGAAQTPLGSTKAQDALVGKKAGSRVLVQGGAQEMLGAQFQQLGMKADDSLVWVIDVQAALKVDKKAEVAGKQAATAAGMPAVKVNKQKPATITIPKGQAKTPPKELKEQVLISGKAADKKAETVKKGQGLVVQYTGVSWDDGKVFDSSWKNGGATAFQIGTRSVVQGWDEGLVGKHVGDRVELVIPAEKAYGKAKSAQNQLGGKTLVFVVDILDTV